MFSNLNIRNRPYLVLFVVVTVGLIVFHWDSIHRFAFASKCADELQDGEYLAVPMSVIMSGNAVALPQDDKVLLDYIRSNNILRPPSKEPYNLERPELEDPSDSQGQYIRKLLNNPRNGFFVECGAADGETFSNTLFMEKNLNWSGLLVEADPSGYEKAIKKNRKAWMANNCLAVKPYPHKVSFDKNSLSGQIISKELNRGNLTRPIEMQCIPLFTFLSALNVTTVDYFSLDVEGYELQVLETIPFDKVFIKTLSVEFAKTIGGRDGLVKFMRSQGFRLNAAMYSQGTPLDLIFVHKRVTVEKMPSQYFQKERAGQIVKINITTYDK